MTRIERIERTLDHVLRLCLALVRKVNQMADNLQRIEREVTEIESVVDGAVTLIKQLGQEIRDGAADPVKMGQLADRLDARATALAEAVAANTPAEDEDGGGEGDDDDTFGGGDAP